MVLVGKTGRINGEIHASDVIIEGDIEANITTEKVEIRDGGKYRGAIIASSIMVSENALFEADVKMKVKEGEPSVRRFTEKRGASSGQD